VSASSVARAATRRASDCAERAQFLSRVLGYERLRTAQGLVRERRKVIVAEASGLRSAMPDPDVVNRSLADAERRLADATARSAQSDARRVAARATLDALTPKWEAQQRERDTLQALGAELRVVDGERAAAERDAARLERELEEAARARSEVERLSTELAPFTGLQAELRELEKSCNEDRRRQTLADTERSLGEELARLRERLTKIESAPALEAEATAALAQTRAELEQAQAQFETSHTEWVRDRQEAETKRQALLDQLRDVNHQRDQIVDLGESGTCPICARPLGTHFRTVLEVLDTQIDTITVDGKYYRARIEQLEVVPIEVQSCDERRRLLFDSIGKLERRLAKVQAALIELNALTQDVEIKQRRATALAAELASISVQYDAGRHAEVRRLVQRLEPMAAQVAKLSAQLERAPQLAAERDRVAVMMSQIRARALELSTRRDALAFSEQSFATLRDAYERAAAELRSSELGAVAADAERMSARAALDAADQARAELSRNETQLAVLVADRRLHEELDRAFTDLRTDLNQALRPELSDLASRYIRELTDGRYSEIELDDQYNIIVLEDAIPKPVISGGEEDLANLVLRLAISEMIAERAGQAFSLLILDEVFGSLDEARRHNVVDLLRRLQDRFEQVILITHIESVREGLDRVVTVRYDEESGTSRVESEAAPGEALDVQAGAAD
jgi:exonuclease SbcC